jgi:hypothetical protein
MRFVSTNKTPAKLAIQSHLSIVSTAKRDAVKFLKKDVAEWPLRASKLLVLGPMGSATRRNGRLDVNIGSSASSMLRLAGTAEIIV